MIGIITVSIICAVLGYSAWEYYLLPQFGKNKIHQSDNFILILLVMAGFILRVILGFVYKGHDTDISCFTAWASSVFENGIPNFYKVEGFTDYPPGYMYILYVIGAIKHLFNISGKGYYLLVKLPAIICDLISGCLIYKIANKKFSNGISAMLGALYLFNPAVICDSALWGQVDSVYTLAIMVMVWLIASKKTELSYFVFAICILLKPQAFIYAPILIFAIIEQYIYPEFKSRELLKSLGIGILAILFMVLVSLPFGFFEVIGQYTKAIGEEYQYFTINAFNIWGLFGLNWHGLNTFGTVFGYIMLVLIVLYCAYVFFKSKTPAKYYFVGALLAFSTYILSIKMHERYAFPVMIFLLLTFIETRDIHAYFSYIAVSIVQFVSYAWVLFIYQTDINKYAFSIDVRILSAINILAFIYMLFVSHRLCNDSIEKAPIKTKAVVEKAKKPIKIQRSKMPIPLVRFDIISIIAVMAVYGAVAIYNLGDTKAPQSEVKLTQSASRLEFANTETVKSLSLYIGDDLSKDRQLAIGYSQSSDVLCDTLLLSSGAKNSWISVDINADIKYLTITATNSPLPIYEARVTDGTGNSIVPQNRSKNNTDALFDEQESEAPKNGVTLVSSGAVLDKDYEISDLKVFLGARELNASDRPLTVLAINSENKPVYMSDITKGSVFCWNSIQIDNTVSKIYLSTISDALYIEELGIADTDNNTIAPLSYTNAELFDEQDMVAERATFKNGTYFDEIYHARTAYEFIHHLSVYEWTHPPLGKVLMSFGIMVFGMTPFGWRIVGTLFGIFMIPIIFIFAKRITKHSVFALLVCLIFTFDFMHFAQTRIATIDVYVTFFIMLMYLFMYEYTQLSFYDTPLIKTLKPLAFCGIAMGLGIASKWTGIYAGAGLGIIFAITMIRRYREYAYALKNPDGITDGMEHKDIIDKFYPCFLRTVGWCVVFFVIVPILIYIASYIPYLMTDGAYGFKTIIDNQDSMLTYHGKTVLGSTHPFSSKWYEWIIIKRPIWYYSGTLENGLKEGISSFGNPFVWWLGIPAFFLMVTEGITKRNKTAIFLCIAYLAQLLPWVGVERLTFIYHYFPTVPFIVLMIGYSIKMAYDEAKNKKAVYIVSGVYVGLVILLFVMFYPVLSGKPTNPDYVNTFLKWFDTWILI
ncbi:MAG: glycosyltransferase family 39 protein [Clostridia bacterium]|nr:glycosyltransferase family 39 protein [Clostridia bacterium]